MHIPVLLQETIALLKPQKGRVYIDATTGGGGHAKAILDAGAKVLGIDRDPSVIPHLMRDPDLDSRSPIAVEDEFRGNDIVLGIGNFADIKSIAEEFGFEKVDGVLFDLGLGSHQLDDPERGFAFQKEGPLDMRYNRLSKIQIPKSKFQKQELTGAVVVNNYSEKELVKIFEKYGEEYRFGKRVAIAIVETRKISALKTTTELFDLIKKSLPGKLRFRAGDTARRIFQALRIEVNQELSNLEKALPQAFDLLKRHGKLVVISFHSLEDRIVKNFFAAKAKGCICPVNFPVCRCSHRPEAKILTKKPIRPSQEEIKINPRSRSAKLRAAVKI